MSELKQSGSFDVELTSANGFNVVELVNFGTNNPRLATYRQDNDVEVATQIESAHVSFNLLNLQKCPFPDITPLDTQADIRTKLNDLEARFPRIDLEILKWVESTSSWRVMATIALQNYENTERHLPLQIPHLTLGDVVLCNENERWGARIRQLAGLRQPVTNGSVIDKIVIKWQWSRIMYLSPKVQSHLTGEIIAYPSQNPPIGWLTCNGSEQSISAYPNLYQLLSTTWGALTNGAGAAGTTHFKLPDFRGRSLIGSGLGQTLTNRAIAQTGGAESHTLSVAEMPSHTHVQNAHTHVQDAHTHVQNAHTHVQDAHTHVQNAHTHTKDSHTHLQNAHGHNYNWFAAPNGANGLVASAGSLSAQANIVASTAVAAVNQTTIATNQNATAVNQTTIATNQNATAANQTTIATNQNATAVNQNTGDGGAHNNMQPFAVINFIIKT